jgi:Icc-related predicted phosphoesterase
MSSERSDSLRVAAIGDLHVHQDSQTRLQAVFDKVSQAADVLALCGDLTQLGLPQEAEKLVSGKVEEVKQILRNGKVIVLEETETFELKGVGFAGAKGFGGGFDKHMLTPFGEETIKHFVTEAVNESLKLEIALNSLRTEKTVVVLHYAPVAGTVAGEPPEIFPFLGSSRLAEAIDHFDVNVVFHGHAHHGSVQGKTMKGTPVYNCCLQLLEKVNPQQPFALVEV